MARICSTCGAASSPTASFCQDCGNSLVPHSGVDSAIAFALSQPAGELCELRCGAFFGHRWKAYGVLRRGLHYFNREDQICPRCGRAAISADAQTDLMIHEQRRSNFWLTMLYLFRR
jgi:ribosomal protein L40E